MVVLAFRHRLQALAYPEPVEVGVQFMQILALVGLLVQAVQAVVEVPLYEQPDKVELLTQAVVGAVDGLLMLQTTTVALAALALSSLKYLTT
jgi:hypothetical protein